MDVVQQGGEHVLLAERHVLERRGVEDDLRAEPLEQASELPRVANVADHRAQANAARRRRSGDLLLDGVEAELAPIEQHQLGGRQRQDLTHQLAADAAAGAGDEHPPAAHQLLKTRLGEADRRSCRDLLDTEQVVGTVGRQLDPARQMDETQAQAARLAHEAATLAVLNGAARDQQPRRRSLGPQVLEDVAADSAVLPSTGTPLSRRPRKRAAIVDDADRPKRGARVVGECLNVVRRVRIRAPDQRLGHIRGPPGTQARMPVQPQIGKASAAQERHQDQA